MGEMTGPGFLPGRVDQSRRRKSSVCAQVEAEEPVAVLVNGVEGQAVAAAADVEAAQSIGRQIRSEINRRSAPVGYACDVANFTASIVLQEVEIVAGWTQPSVRRRIFLLCQGSQVACWNIPGKNASFRAINAGMHDPPRRVFRRNIGAAERVAAKALPPKCAVFE